LPPRHGLVEYAGYAGVDRRGDPLFSCHMLLDSPELRGQSGFTFSDAALESQEMKLTQQSSSGNPRISRNATPVYSKTGVADTRRAAVHRNSFLLIAGWIVGHASCVLACR
jgi:hypothetical protein